MLSICFFCECFALLMRWWILGRDAINFIKKFCSSSALASTRSPTTNLQIACSSSWRHSTTHLDREMHEIAILRLANAIGVWTCYGTLFILTIQLIDAGCRRVHSLEVVCPRAFACFYCILPPLISIICQTAIIISHVIIVVVLGLHNLAPSHCITGESSFPEPRWEGKVVAIANVFSVDCWWTCYKKVCPVNVRSLRCQVCWYISPPVWSKLFLLPSPVTELFQQGHVKLDAFGVFAKQISLASEPLRSERRE